MGLTNAQMHITLSLNLRNLKPLDKLCAGERAYIVDMRNSKLCEKFFELGIFPGDLVEVKINSLDKNSLVIIVNNKTFNIFRQAAETIITHSVSFEFSLN
ncbi:MAG: FeoA family protein [Chitinophagales bacterium]